MICDALTNSRFTLFFYMEKIVAEASYVKMSFLRLFAIAISPIVVISYSIPREILISLHVKTFFSNSLKSKQKKGCLFRQPSFYSFKDKSTHQYQYHHLLHPHLPEESIYNDMVQNYREFHLP